jgi:hypothetical protein
MSVGSVVYIELQSSSKSLYSHLIIQPRLAIGHDVERLAAAGG